MFFLLLCYSYTDRMHKEYKEFWNKYENENWGLKSLKIGDFLGQNRKVLGILKTSTSR